MRELVLLGLILLLSGCQYYEDDDNDGYTCSARDQKRFVRDATEYWYLWNDLLPDKTRVGDYDGPAELLADMTSVQPIDTFSYIDSAAADAAFFGAGQYEGFGFSWQRSSNGDLYLTRVFAASPAAAAGFSRGQRILAIDGRPIAEIDMAEGLDKALDSQSVEFTMQETDGVTEFAVTIDRSVVTIDPVPQWRLIATAAGPPVGYVELSTFVSTADPKLQAAFAEFRDNGVTDVIVDLRYNGGGLISTAELLGDLLGGDVAENLTFKGTRFNQDRAANNDFDTPFLRLANSVSLSRLVVIASGITASASELVINGLEPHVEVTIVGDRTYGKPVGQVGFEFCGSVLRLTAFRNVNADGFGDYFDGLPADCTATDNLELPVGDANDPNLVAALDYLATGACPPQPASARLPHAGPGPASGPDGPAHREFAGAW
jgi:carboxyl-terminal processing protease